MKYTFYSRTDGRYLGSIDTASAESLARNTPDGAVAIEGAHSHESFLSGGTPCPIPQRPGKYETWDFTLRQWRDVRDDARRAADAAEEIAADRRDAYPPLADLADALYWQSRGDDSKMDAYNAAVAAVKAKFPKSN